MTEEINNTSLEEPPTYLDINGWTQDYGNHITDDKALITGYGQYYREQLLKNKELTQEKEYEIQVAEEQELRQLDPEYSRPHLTGTVDTDAAVLREVNGDLTSEDYYAAIQDGAKREDFIEELNEAKTHLLEQDIIKFASIAQKNEDGNYEYTVVGNPNIVDKNLAITDSLKRGVLRHRDLWQIPIGTQEVQEGISRFKAIRNDQVAGEFAEASKLEDATQYDKVVALAKQHYLEGGEPSTLLSEARTLLGTSYIQGKNVPLNSARNRFQDSEILEALEQVATFDLYNTGEVPYISDKDKLGDNIKLTQTGRAIPHAELLLRKTDFETAISQKLEANELSGKQEKALRKYRTAFLLQQYEHFDEFFKDGPVSSKWTQAKLKGANRGQSNEEILDNFLSDPKNYSAAKGYFGAVWASIKDSFVGLAFVIPALFGSETAIDVLVNQEEARQKRRETARVFRKEFGLFTDVSTQIFPMVTDVSATVLLSTGTLGAGGLTYLSAKQGAKLTAKGFVGGLLGSSLRKQFGETGKEAAFRMATKDKILKLTTPVTSKIKKSDISDDIADAIDSYNKLIANKTVVNRVQNAAIFATAANRSAGGTYAVVYSNLDGTHEEKHDKALGAALLAGAATGIITSGFSAIGRGGFENAFLRGMTFNQMRYSLQRLGRSRLSKLDTEGILRDTLTTKIKEMSPRAFPDFYRRFLKGGTEEYVEEAIDDFVNSFITDAALDEHTPMIEKVNGALYAGLIGGIIGQGASAVRSIADKRQAAYTGQLAAFQLSQENELIQALKDNDSPITAALVERKVRSLMRGPTGIPISESVTQRVERARRKIKEGRGEEVVPEGEEGIETGPEFSQEERAGLIEEGSNLGDEELDAVKANIKAQTPEDEKDAINQSEQLSKEEQEFAVNASTLASNFGKFKEAYESSIERTGINSEESVALLNEFQENYFQLPEDMNQWEITLQFQVNALRPELDPEKAKMQITYERWPRQPAEGEGLSSVPRENKTIGIKDEDHLRREINYSENSLTMMIGEQLRVEEDLGEDFRIEAMGPDYLRKKMNLELRIEALKKFRESLKEEATTEPALSEEEPALSEEETQERDEEWARTMAQEEGYDSEPVDTSGMAEFEGFPEELEVTYKQWPEGTDFIKEPEPSEELLVEVVESFDVNAEYNGLAERISVVQGQLERSRKEKPMEMGFHWTKEKQILLVKNLELELQALEKENKQFESVFLFSQINLIPEDDYQDKGLNKDDIKLKGQVQESIIDMREVAAEYGVEVRLITKAEREAAKAAGQELKHIQYRVSDKASYIIVDPLGVAAFIEGKSSFSGKGLMRALLSEEIIHAAAVADLSVEEINQVYDSLPKHKIFETVGLYYNTQADREASMQKLQSEDAGVRQKEIFAITHEYLRMQSQRAMRGYTTEQDNAFYRNNPSILSIVIRYFKALIRRLSTHLTRDRKNPHLSMAMSRISKSLNDMKKGWRSNEPPAFDPINPLENFTVLASQITTDPEEPLDPTEGILYSQVEPDGSTSELLIRFGDLTGMLELPVLYSGKYRGKYRGVRKWINSLVGSADPRLRKLYEHEVQLRNAIFDELQLYQTKLAELVAKEYPAGNPPVELFRAITGSGISTRLNPKDVKFIEDFFIEQRDKLDRAKSEEAKLVPEDMQEATKFMNDLDAKYDTLFELLEGRKDTAFEKAYQNQKARVSLAREEAINQMGGYKKDNRTPKGELAAHLLSLREKLDQFSLKIKELYPNDTDLQNKENLGATIDHNLGIYITRSYRLFSEAGYAQKVMEDEEYSDIRKKVAKHFEKEYIYHRAAKIYKEGYKVEGKDEIQKVYSRPEAEEIARKEITDSRVKGEEGISPIIENMMIDYLASFAPNNSAFELPTIKEKWKGKSYGISKILKEKLEKRKDIPSVLRDFLGEEKDQTGYDAVMKTYMHVGIMASHQAFLRNLFELGRNPENKWILTRAEMNQLPDKERYRTVKGKKEDAWKRIKADDDARFDPYLSEGTTLYAPKDLIEAVQNIADSTQYSLSDADVSTRTINNAVAKLTGSSMAIKTLGSIGFYLRNALSNVLFFGPAQGIIAPIKLTRAAIKEANRKRWFFLGGKFKKGKGIPSWKQGAEEVEAYYSELQALGIIQDEIRPKMLEELLDGDTTPKELMDKISETAGKINALGDETTLREDLKNVKKPIGKLYKNLKEMSAACDIFYKIFYFEHELKVLRKAKERGIRQSIRGDQYAEMKDYDLKRAAADKVKMTAQSYSQAAPLVRGAARSTFGMIFAPFIRFKGEVVRVVVNTIRLARQEIFDKNPVIRRRGARRIGGATAVMTLASAGISTLTRKVLAEISAEDEEALRKTLQPYLKGHTFWFFKNDDGKIQTLDMTYLNPFSQVADPFLRALNKMFAGENLSGITIEFTKSLILEEYFDEQIFFGALSSVLKNRDPNTGKQIWEPRDEPEAKFEAGAWYLIDEAFTPRTAKAAYEVSRLIGDNSLKEAGRRAWREFKPVSKYTLDLYPRIKSYLYSARRETGEVTLRKNALLRDDYISDDEMNAYVMDEIDHRVRIDKDVADTVLRLAKMEGMDEYALRQAVKESKFGQRRWANMMLGRTEIPKETNKGLKQRLLKEWERTKDEKFKYRANYVDSIYSALDQYRYWDE